MPTLELAWLELWLDATTAHRPPATGEPLPQAEAAAPEHAKPVPPGRFAGWRRHSPFLPGLRFPEALAPEALALEALALEAPGR